VYYNNYNYYKILSGDVAEVGVHSTLPSRRLKLTKERLL